MDKEPFNAGLPKSRFSQNTRAIEYIIDYTAFEMREEEKNEFGDAILISASRCGRLDAWSLIGYQSSKILYEIPKLKEKVYCVRGFVAGEVTREIYKAKSCYFFLAGVSQSVIYLYEATEGKLLQKIQDQSYNSDLMVFSKQLDGSLKINDSLFAPEQRKNGGFDFNYAFGVGAPNQFKIFDLSNGSPVVPKSGPELKQYASLNCIEPICQTKSKKGILFALGDKSTILSVWKLQLEKGMSKIVKKRDIDLPIFWVLTIASFWKYSGTSKYKDLLACAGGPCKQSYLICIVNWRKKLILRSIPSSTKWINVLRINYFVADQDSGKSIPILIKGGADGRLEYRSLLTGLLVECEAENNDMVVMHGMKVLSLFQGEQTRDILISSMKEWGTQKFKISF